MFVFDLFAGIVRSGTVIEEDIKGKIIASTPDLVYWIDAEKATISIATTYTVTNKKEEEEQKQQEQPRRHRHFSIIVHNHALFKGLNRDHMITWSGTASRAVICATSFANGRSTVLVSCINIGGLVAFPLEDPVVFETTFMNDVSVVPISETRFVIYTHTHNADNERRFAFRTVDTTTLQVVGIGSMDDTRRIGCVIVPHIGVIMAATDTSIVFLTSFNGMSTIYDTGIPDRENLHLIYVSKSGLGVFGKPEQAGMRYVVRSLDPGDTDKVFGEFVEPYSNEKDRKMSVEFNSTKQMRIVDVGKRRILIFSVRRELDPLTGKESFFVVARAASNRPNEPAGIRVIENFALYPIMDEDGVVFPEMQLDSSTYGINVTMLNEPLGICLVTFTEEKNYGNAILTTTRSWCVDMERGAIVLNTYRRDTSSAKEGDSSTDTIIYHGSSEVGVRKTQLPLTFPTIVPFQCNLWH